ncbi:hypothetical protein AX14_007909 [Amanita brunnescens Koide BX004]|nr:hypothetical protein AX14_007909 [Amanita brunnescens Koide BX004]
MHDSTTLLEPSEEDAPVRTDLNNNRGISGAYNESILSRRSFSSHYQAEDDCRSLGKHRNRSKQELFIRPIVACSWQFIVLVMLTAFIIRTETTAHRIVPARLATLHQQYPQGTATAITLTGSLLSLLSTKTFTEAIRFATVVSLASPGSKNMSLYSLYARITVGSGDALFDFGKGRRAWTFISLVSLLLFTVQTAAWTTILTPRATDIPYPTSFQDFNYTAPYNVLSVAKKWAQAWESGYAAAKNSETNMTSFFYGYVLNGTSRGISPIAPTFDNWTRVEAIQQGITAEVNCKVTPASDPDIRVSQTTVADGIMKVTLCCACPSMEHVVVYKGTPYLAFTSCPISDTDNVITTYIIGRDDFDQVSVWNQTCIIKPQWLNVHVTYDRGGFVTLEPVTQLPDITLTSWIIQSAIIFLEDHFSNSQTMQWNNIQDTIIEIADPSGSDLSDSESQVKEQPTKVMADYIRGVFEFGAAVARSGWIQEGIIQTESGPPLQSFSSTTYVHVIVWGQTPRYRLIIAISPLAIMITTITIILASLYRARRLDVDYIASFNAMDTLHIISACSSGDVHAVSFPDYSKDIGLFSKDVEVGLTEVKNGSGVAGFRLSQRSKEP